MRMLMILGLCLFLLLPTALSAQVKVSFKQPEKFTDFADDDFNNDKQRRRLQDELTRHLETQAKRRLGESVQLKVVFTDIDMAGDLLHGIGSGSRIMKPIYYPELKFTYWLQGKAGESECLHGHETVTDMDFLRMNPRASRYRNRPLSYEKALLDRWLAELAVRQKNAKKKM